MVNGSPALGPDKECSVMFTGSGSTAAINKMVHILKLKGSSPKPVADRHVIFISNQEHHANILPWRCETNADIVFIRNNKYGQISLQHLDEQLKLYKDRPLKIGSFSAGSNITGILNNVDAISILLHKYGALAMFDYAGVGAYVKIDMNPVSKLPFGHLAYKDAVFISPHKYIGGPGTPGLLVVRTKLMKEITDSSYIPNQVGGGIVVYVDKKKQLLTSDIEDREEAGTQAIVESIRCGAVFLTKQAIGQDFIMNEELAHFEYIKNRLAKFPAIQILGDLTKPRVPVLSFSIHDLALKELGLPYTYHFNFISSLLNDLFGIQARGGCMCAAPYAVELLGISDDVYKAGTDIADKEASENNRYEQIFPILKPGFVRLSFNYFISHEEMDFVLDAMIWVSTNAKKMLPFYGFDTTTGAWFEKSTDHGEFTNMFLEEKKTNLNALSFQECFEFADKLVLTKPTTDPDEELLSSFALDKVPKEMKWFITYDR